MVSPIDYTLNVINPMQGYLEGIKFGEGILGARQQRAASEQAMQIQKAQYEEAQRARAAARAAAAQKVADAKKAQAELVRLYELGDKATSDDWNRAWIANPAIREQIGQVKSMIEGPKLNALTKDAQDLYLLSRSGNTDLVKSTLDEKITAIQNSEDKAMLDAYSGLRDLMETNPQEAMKQLSTTAGISLMGFIGPDAFKKLNESMSFGAPEPTEAFRTLDAKLRAAGIMPQSEGGDGTYELSMKRNAVTEPAPLTDFGKIELDYKQGRIPKAVYDAKLAEIVKPTGIDPKIFEAEKGLRKEYNDQVSDYVDIQNAYRRMISAPEDGAGDLALVFSYMKVLDPTSVVREGEFANAESAGGVPAKVWNLYNKVKAGDRLPPEQRTMFKNAAKTFVDAAAQREAEVRNGLMKTIIDQGLNPDRVFYVKAPEISTTEAIEAPVIETGELNFSTMTLDDLLKVDVMSLTPEQVDAMDKRFKELE